MYPEFSVKPGAKQQKIEEVSDGSLIISLKSPPVAEKANEELIWVLSKRFNVSKSQISIKSGLSSQYKWVEIEE